MHAQTIKAVNSQNSRVYMILLFAWISASYSWWFGMMKAVPLRLD